MTDQLQQNQVVRLVRSVGKYQPGTLALKRGGGIDFDTVELAFPGDSKWHQASPTAFKDVPEDEIPPGIVFGA